MKVIDYYDIEIRFSDNSRDLELSTNEEPYLYSPFVQLKKRDGSSLWIREDEVIRVKCKPVFKED